MIETPRAPAAPVIAPPIQPPARSVRSPKVFRGAPPTELALDEKAATVEPPKLWVPVIPAERKRALLELHQQVAEKWTQNLRASSRQGDKIKLAGFTFESADRLAAEQTDGSSVTLFAADGTRMAGCVLVSASLSAYFASYKVEIDKPDNSSPSVVRLTRLETMVARGAIEGLVTQLIECYGRAGIPNLKSTGRDEGLKSTPLFGSQDYLAVCRYGLGDPEKELSVTVALNIDLVDAIRVNPTITRAPVASPRVGRFAEAVPVEATIVLGSWRVPVGELAGLKLGDEIVLPAGDDAWLEVAGIPIRAVRVEVDGVTLRGYLRGT
jgi:Type III flagellar switch regulator (C-ring) FliN C-term